MLLYQLIYVSYFLFSRKSLTAENTRASIISTSNLSSTENEIKSLSGNSQIKGNTKTLKNVKLNSTIVVTNTTNITPKRPSINGTTTATVVSLDLSKSFRSPNTLKKSTTNKLTPK